MNKRTIAVIIPAVLAVAGAAYRLTARTAAVAGASFDEQEVRLIAGAGRVEPLSEEVNVAADIDGRLASVAVEEGERVRRGQIIAVIENDDFAARVQIAAAAVNERRAELERVVNGSRIEQRLESDAAMREAEAALEHARIERKRRTALAESGLIARTEFDLSEREFRLAEAR